MSKIRNSIIAGSALMASAVAFTSYFESGAKGSRLEAYLDQGGVPTICDGVTRGVKMGMKVTQEWCDQRLIEEIELHTKPLDRIKYQMPDNARIAWGDFILNLGETKTTGNNSTAWRFLVNGDIHRSCNAFLMWKFTAVNKVKRDCSDPASKCGGIWTRRNAQRDLCHGKITVDEFLIRVRGTPVKHGV